MANYSTAPAREVRPPLTPSIGPAGARRRNTGTLPHDDRLQVDRFLLLPHGLPLRVPASVSGVWRTAEQPNLDTGQITAENPLCGQPLRAVSSRAFNPNRSATVRATAAPVSSNSSPPGNRSQAMTIRSVFAGRWRSAPSVRCLRSRTVAPGCGRDRRRSAGSRRGSGPFVLRPGSARVVEIGEVLVVEPAAVEPSAEPAEGTGVRPAGVRADGGRDESAGRSRSGARSRPRRGSVLASESVTGNDAEKLARVGDILTKARFAHQFRDFAPAVPNARPSRPPLQPAGWPRPAVRFPAASAAVSRAVRSPAGPRSGMCRSRSASDRSTASSMSRSRTTRGLAPSSSPYSQSVQQCRNRLAASPLTPTTIYSGSCPATKPSCRIASRRTEEVRQDASNAQAALVQRAVQHVTQRRSHPPRACIQVRQAPADPPIAAAPESSG